MDATLGTGGVVADQGDVGTRSIVLDLIIEKGPITSSSIAKILALTTAAVRRHITSLEESGDIAEHVVQLNKPRGRGRPARYYVATGAGRETRHDGYADIALKAISYLGTTIGEEAIDAFAAARSRELVRRYTPVVAKAGSDTKLRAQALADALTDDGYAATIRPVGSGDFAVQLCQGHCPIEHVAQAYPCLCEAELQAFAKLLGVHVQRLATLAQGEHVCTTHIPLGMPGLHPAARAAFRKGKPTKSGAKAGLTVEERRDGLR